MSFSFQKKSLKSVILVIKFPKFSETRHFNNQLAMEISKAAKLFGIFRAAKFPIALEIETPNVSSTVNFQLAIPEFMAEPVIRKMRHLWPEHKVAIADSKSIFNSTSSIKGLYLNQKYSHFLPIQSGREISNDTIASLIKTFSSIENIGEGIAMQIIFRPAGTAITYEIKKIGWQIKMGLEARQIFGAATTPALLEDNQAFELFKKKTAQPLFEVNIRLVAAAPSQFQSEYLIKNLTNVFKIGSRHAGDELKLTKPRDQEKFIAAYLGRSFDEAHKLILTAKELAGLFHLPVNDGSNLKLDFWQAPELDAPAQLPNQGVFVGYSNFPDQQPVFISDQDRRRHIAIIGHNQAGKNDLLAHMAADDMRKGLGVAVIDASGELTGMLLNSMPPERLDDVLTFDASDAQRLLGLNLLEYQNRDDKEYVAHEVASIFSQLYGIGTNKNSFAAKAVKRALALLIEDFNHEPASLMDLPRIFSDADFRNRKLARSADTELVKFWKEDFKQAFSHDPFVVNELVAYINSNFIHHISHKSFKNLTTQPKSVVNIREAMDNGKIILVNLATGAGAPAGSLLGRIMLAKIFGASLLRANLSQWHRREFNLYINDWSDFSHDALNQILSSGTKYLLNITLGLETLATMPEKMRQLIGTKFASLIALRADKQTARQLTEKFQLAIGQAEFINIDDFRAYARILVNGKVHQPFNLKIPAYQMRQRNLSQRIKEYAHLRHRS